ncbi:hypothetical protein bthur0009_2220 [Bacillus thuringiensis serovar andalousiensis BGSC 4AW1]|nr:hypothetical protein bthur0007_2160 [Bacillus thuringiensis serovar monterrey BGSC 4AJ1]EEM73669.1 hypothetical protein bthur0009_2220 [Bacillus thuringiensis serovar andalousiensis BGSC 4AW1]
MIGIRLTLLILLLHLLILRNHLLLLVILALSFCILLSFSFLQNFYYTNTLDRNTINAVNTTAPLADPTKSPFVTCNTCSFILCILLFNKLSICNF